MRVLFFVLIFTLCSPLKAALLEASFTANFKNSKVDDNNFEQSLSFTGGIAYYFWDNSAFELAYTKGESLISIKPSEQDEKIQYLSDYELFGANFLIYFNSKKQAFQPYIKLGVAHIEKQVTKKSGDSADDFDSTTIKSSPSLVPTLGAGFKYFLTKSISFRIGLDAWSSDLTEDPIIWDYAAKAGLSFYL